MMTTPIANQTSFRRAHRTGGFVRFAALGELDGLALGVVALTATSGEFATKWSLLFWPEGDVHPGEAGCREGQHGDRGETAEGFELHARCPDLLSL
jgi:hypothetical protein